MNQPNGPLTYSRRADFILGLAGMMKKTTVPACLAAFLIAVALLAGFVPPAAADSSIRVLVNDQAITSFDIAQRTKLMALAHEKGGVKDATEQLINELIELDDAKKHGFTIPDS